MTIAERMAFVIVMCVIETFAIGEPVSLSPNSSASPALGLDHEGRFKLSTARSWTDTLVAPWLAQFMQPVAVVEVANNPIAPSTL